MFTVGDGVVGGTTVGVGGCKKYSRSKVKQKIFFMPNAETSNCFDKQQRVMI